MFVFFALLPGGAPNEEWATVIVRSVRSGNAENLEALSNKPLSILSRIGPAQQQQQTVQTVEGTADENASQEHDDKGE